jgi:hypothetical protein
MDLGSPRQLAGYKCGEDRQDEMNWEGFEFSDREEFVALK